MKWIKMIVGLLIALFLVSTLAVLIVTTCVNPNQFKPMIADQVKKYTNRELVMDGNLSWSVFPYLGVKVGHSELMNPPGFNQKIFAQFESLTMGIKILSLFQAKVESSGLALKEMKLFLIKNAEGKTNWSDLYHSSPAVKTESTSEVSHIAKKASMGLAIAGMNISNASINYLNEQTHQEFDIVRINLRAKKISFIKPFPLAMHFRIISKNPDWSGKIKLTSKIALNLENQTMKFDDIMMFAKLSHGEQKYEMKMNGESIADLAQHHFSINNILAEMGNLKLEGNFNIASLDSIPKVTGHLQVFPFDFKQWLASTGQNVNDVQTFKNLGGIFDFTAASGLNSIDMQGNITIEEIQAAKCRLSDIKIATQIQNGMLSLSSIKAAFYQGTLDGNAKMDLNKNDLPIYSQLTVSNAQIGSLLADVSTNHQLKFTGTSNIDLQLAMLGAGPDSMISNLNGIGHLSVNNGTLEGVDVGYLVDSAFALANRKALPTDNAQKTQFNSLTANFVIQKGVMTNKDLVLNSPRFEANGNGKIDFVNQQINYNLEASSNQALNKSNKNIHDLPIPITISGRLEKPNVYLDTNKLMNAVAQTQMKKASKLDKKLGKYKNKIPNKAKEFLSSILDR